jgi:peroxiredoxin
MADMIGHQWGLTPQMQNNFMHHHVILWQCNDRQRTSRPGGWTYGLTCGLLAILFLFVPPPLATGQSDVVPLLSTLDLSAYPSGVWPPPFKGQTATGKSMSLADLKGRVVLMNFWASWCAECRPEMPMFEQLHQTFAEQGLTVLGINYREATARIEWFAQKLGLTFPHVLDPEGVIAAAYGVIGLPSTFLVGRDGRPVALAVGPRAWNSAEARAIIQALLAETVAQKERQ